MKEVLDRVWGPGGMHPLAMVWEGVSVKDSLGTEGTQ